MSAPRIDHYDWPGGREAMLRFGPDRAPTVIAALPLFEEANRTRASLIAVLRRLAGMGIASALPDLPGAGESLVATAQATLAAWRTAFAAAAAVLPGPVHVVAWRGGALVDAEAVVASRWWLAPIDGAGTMRDLRRMQAASADKESFAGNRLSAALIDELENRRLPYPVEPATSVRPELVEERPSTGLGRTEAGGRADNIRIVRLDTDPRGADAKVSGRPLWRAAEPGTDAALEQALAVDIAAWIRP